MRDRFYGYGGLQYDQGLKVSGSGFDLRHRCPGRVCYPRQMLNVPTVTNHGRTVLGTKGAPLQSAANRRKAPGLDDTFNQSSHLPGRGIPNVSVQSEASDIRMYLSAAFSKAWEPEPDVRNPGSDLSTRALATLLVGKDEDAARAFCQRSLSPDLRRSELIDSALAPAIRLLGTRWDRNELCFSDVSVAAARAQLISRSWKIPDSPLSTGQRPRHAVFATLARQRHMLGIILAAHAFREQRHWDVDLLLNASESEIVRRAKTMRSSVIGFTVGERRDVRDVHRAVLALRALPFHTKIIVGGNAASLLEQYGNQFLVHAVVPDIASALEAVTDK